MDLFTTPVLLGLMAVICAVVYMMSRARKPRHQLPPGPRGLERLLGLLYIMRTGRSPEMVTKWAEKYGDIMLVDGLEFGHQVVVLSDPADVRELYTGKTTRAVVNSRQLNKIKSALMPNITFSSPEHSYWSKQRKLFHQSLQFYGEGYQSMERTIQAELQSLVKTLHGKAGQDVEVRSLFFNSILNLIHILLTGAQLEVECPVRQDMVAYIGSIVAILHPSFQLPATYFPFMLYVPGRMKTTWDTFNQRLKRVVQHFYHDVKATHTAGNIRGIVDAWIAKMENEDSDWMREENAIGLLNDVVIGGTLTTSETLTSMFLFLLNHREVVRKIQAEVDSVVASDQIPGLEHRDQCHYAQATVLETLRVLSLLPSSVPHKVIADMEFKGFFIPKGTQVYANQWRFHRSEALWSDARQFQPERFLDERGQLLPANHPVRMQMLPFGVGLRSCPGESFARARLFLYLTTILQHFDPLTPCSGDLPPFTPDLDSWNMSAFMVAQGYSCQFVKRERR